MKEIDHLVFRSKKFKSRTSFIRAAITSQLEEQKRETVRTQFQQVIDSIGLFQDEVISALLLCWRAAAESIAVDLEIQRRNLPNNSEEEISKLKRLAKERSNKWASEWKAASAIDLAELKHSPKKTKVRATKPVDGQQLIDSADIKEHYEMGQATKKKTRKPQQK